MAELQRIDFEKGEFIGRSGKLYKLDQSLSAERYAHFQLQEKELAYGLSVQGMADKFRKLYELQNKMKFADAAVLVSDLMKGIKLLHERKPTILKICALYCNSDDEEKGVYNVDLMNAKIEDFGSIDIRDFFQVATGSVRGLIEIYLSVTQNIMEAPADIKE